MRNQTKIEMLSKEQLKILAAFKKNPFAKATFKELKSLIKTRSQSRIQNALKKFQELDLIKKETIADVSTYELNLANNEAILYLFLIDLEYFRQKKQLYAQFSEITEQIEKQTEFFSLILFGSYSKGEETKKSDIDIAIIVENEETKSTVKPETEIIKRKSLPKLDFQVFSRAEFIEMLKNDEENVGKEIARSNIIFSGAEIYYNILRKMHNETINKAIFRTS